MSWLTKDKRIDVSNGDTTLPVNVGGGEGDTKGKTCLKGWLSCSTLFGACLCCLAFATLTTFFAFWIAGAVYTDYAKNVLVQYQFTYANSKPPAPLNGFYWGTPDGFFLSTLVSMIPWKGKRFNSTTSTGINMLNGPDDTSVPDFAFRTWFGKSVTDPNVDCFKIDYDIPTNAVWLRSVLDELVEIKPGYYIGKMQWIPWKGTAWTLGYFELKDSA